MQTCELYEIDDYSVKVDKYDRNILELHDGVIDSFLSKTKDIQHTICQDCIIDPRKMDHSNITKEIIYISGLTKCNTLSMKHIDRLYWGDEKLRTSYLSNPSTQTFQYVDVEFNRLNHVKHIHTQNTFEFHLNSLSFMREDIDIQIEHSFTLRNSLVNDVKFMEGYKHINWTLKNTILSEYTDYTRLTNHPEEYLKEGIFSDNQWNIDVFGIQNHIGDEVFELRRTLLGDYFNGMTVGGNNGNYHHKKHKLIDVSNEGVLNFGDIEIDRTIKSILVYRKIFNRNCHIHLDYEDYSHYFFGSSSNGNDSQSNNYHIFFVECQWKCPNIEITSEDMDITIKNSLIDESVSQFKITQNHNINYINIFGNQFLGQDTHFQIEGSQLYFDFNYGVSDRIDLFLRESTDSLYSLSNNRYFKQLNIDFVEKSNQQYNYVQSNDEYSSTSGVVFPFYQGIRNNHLIGYLYIDNTYFIDSTTNNNIIHSIISQIDDHYSSDEHFLLQLIERQGNMASKINEIIIPSEFSCVLDSNRYLTLEIYRYYCNNDNHEKIQITDKINQNNVFIDEWSIWSKNSMNRDYNLRFTNQSLEENKPLLFINQPKNLQGGSLSLEYLDVITLSIDPQKIIYTEWFNYVGDILIRNCEIHLNDKSFSRSNIDDFHLKVVMERNTFIDYRDDQFSTGPYFEIPKITLENNIDEEVNFCDFLIHGNNIHGIVSNFIYVENICQSTDITLSKNSLFMNRQPKNTLFDAVFYFGEKESHITNHLSIFDNVLNVSNGDEISIDTYFLFVVSSVKNIHLENNEIIGGIYGGLYLKNTSINTVNEFILQQTNQICVQYNDENNHIVMANPFADVSRVLNNHLLKGKVVHYAISDSLSSSLYSSSMNINYCMNSEGNNDYEYQNTLLDSSICPTKVPIDCIVDNEYQKKLLPQKHYYSDIYVFIDVHEALKKCKHSSTITFRGNNEKSIHSLTKDIDGHQPSEEDNNNVRYYTETPWVIWNFSEMINNNQGESIKISDGNFIIDNKHPHVIFIENDVEIVFIDCHFEMRNIMENINGDNELKNSIFQWSSTLKDSKNKFDEINHQKYETLSGFTLRFIRCTFESEDFLGRLFSLNSITKNFFNNRIDFENCYFNNIITDISGFDWINMNNNIWNNGHVTIHSGVWVEFNDNEVNIHKNPFELLKVSSDYSSSKNDDLHHHLSFLSVEMMNRYYQTDNILRYSDISIQRNKINENWKHLINDPHQVLLKYRKLLNEEDNSDIGTQQKYFYTIFRIIHHGYEDNQLTPIVTSNNEIDCGKENSQEYCIAYRFQVNDWKKGNMRTHVHSNTFTSDVWLHATLTDPSNDALIIEFPEQLSHMFCDDFFLCDGDGDSIVIIVVLGVFVFSCCCLLCCLVPMDHQVKKSQKCD